QVRYENPRCPVLERGTQARDLHPPADEPGMLEGALDQPVKRMCEHGAIGDGSEDRARGADRLGRLAAHDLLDHLPRREPPDAAAGRSELRDDRFLRQRRELAQGREPELAEPAVCVGIERKDGERLGGEKCRLLPWLHDHCMPRLRPARGNPGDELSEPPPNPEFGMWNAECGM